MKMFNRKSFQTKSMHACLLCNELDTTDQNETVTLAISKKKTQNICAQSVLLKWTAWEFLLD